MSMVTLVRKFLRLSSQLGGELELSDNSWEQENLAPPEPRLTIPFLASNQQC